MNCHRTIWFKVWVREEHDFKRRSRLRPTILIEVDRGFPQSIVKVTLNILYFVDRASRYNCTKRTNSMHYLSLVYFISQPLHISGIFVANHQEVYCIYTTIGTCCALHLTVCWQGLPNMPKIFRGLLKK